MLRGMVQVSPYICSSLHIMMVTSSVSFLQALVSICMYMYVNVCIMYVYCSICMYMYVYVCICMYNSKVGVKKSKYEKQYMRVYWCICMYMYVFVGIWTYVYVYIGLHIYIHTYTDMGWEVTPSHCQWCGPGVLQVQVTHILASAIEGGFGRRRMGICTDTHC